MKILVAEDEPISRMRLARALHAWGYSVEVAKDGNEAWRILGESTGPMLLIFDWMMPGMDGLELCRRVKGDTDKRFHYVIVLTARTDMQDIVAAIESGADDFMTKPYHPDELKVRVRAGVRILQLQTELQLKASHDELTSVLSRRMVLEMLDREVERARRHAQPLALAIADIDHFKVVNDTYGHPIGDEVLRQTASRIGASLRKNDSLGRYGGEEFLVVLPSCEELAATEVAERIRSAVSAQPIVTAKASIHVTVSVGLATAPGAGELGRDAMILAADHALYRAKTAGRDRVGVGTKEDS